LGYEFESAIADIVDNSLDAKARNIFVEIDIAHGGYVAVSDDGEGMSKEKLTEALSLAASAFQPSLETESLSRSRLGKFGMGLKTASISQARVLTVVSKRKSQVNAIRLDLDILATRQNWDADSLSTDEIADLPFISKILSATQGTLVIWQNLDRLLENVDEPSKFLAGRVTTLTDALALTFHRLLGTKEQGVRLFINEKLITPLDLFLEANSHTQVSRPESFSIGTDSIIYKAFTLPGAKRLTPLQALRADLGEDLHEWQGFYFYRNERLIAREGWRGLSRNSKLSQNTRVQVDLPAGLDSLAGIEITKSIVKRMPPAFLKSLKERLPFLQGASKRLNTFKGRRIDEGVQNLWSKFRSNENGFWYEVNLENSLLRELLAELDPVSTQRVRALIKSLQSSFPYHDLAWEYSRNATPEPPSDDKDQIENLLKVLHDTGALESRDALLSFASKTQPLMSVDTKVLTKLVDEIWGRG